LGSRVQRLEVEGLEFRAVGRKRWWMLSPGEGGQVLLRAQVRCICVCVRACVRACVRWARGARHRVMDEYIAPSVFLSDSYSHNPAEMLCADGAAALVIKGCGRACDQRVRPRL
jgi:hypothetical protein